MAIVSEYLPQQLTEEEIEKVITEIMNSTGAKGMADLGKLMSEAMKVLKNKADGKLVQQIVRKKLA